MKDIRRTGGDWLCARQRMGVGNNSVNFLHAWRAGVLEAEIRERLQNVVDFRCALCLGTHEYLTKMKRYWGISIDMS